MGNATPGMFTRQWAPGVLASRCECGREHLVEGDGHAARRALMEWETQHREERHAG